MNIDMVREVFTVIVSQRVGKAVEPYSYQQRMFEAMEKLMHGYKDVIVFIAPCGGGKTESVIAPFLTQFVSSNVIIPRLIYATPTQTLLYNMKKRFKDYVDTLNKQYPRSFNIWYNKLRPDVEHGFDVDPSYLIPRFTVSTYDVVVYAWMARRTIPWRPFTTRGALLSSLVVFDEVHLLQDIYAYSQRVFPELVVSMARLGIPVVIMSATLPYSIVNHIVEKLGKDRVEIVRADGLEMKSGRISVKVFEGDQLRLEEALKVIEGYVVKAIDERKDILLVFNTVKVAYEVFDCLLNFLNSKYGDRIGVIGSATEFFELVKQGKDILLCFVHGRLPIGIRKVREEVFEIAKRCRRDDKRWSFIAIATQVAEVGIDYSFDVVITECAPPSALIQRIMRSGRVEGQEAEALILPPIVLETTDRKYIPSYLVYTKDLVYFGLEWARREKLTSEKLKDVDFLVKSADEEHCAIITHAHAKEWVEDLVERAGKIIEFSEYLPPLVTAVHREILERFKLRLGEYIAVHMIPEHLSITNTEELEHTMKQYLSSLKVSELIDRSVKFSIRIRREDEDYVYRIPSMCIWRLGERVLIPFIESLIERKVSYVELYTRRNKLYARSLHDMESIFGRIVLAMFVPDYREDLGLVEVKYDEIRVPRCR